MTKGLSSGRTKQAVLVLAVVCAVMSSALSACGGHSKGTAGKSVSVFNLRPQDCLNPPKANPNLAVSSVTVLPCSQPHVDEVYCVLPYSPTPPSSVIQCPARPPRFAGSLTEDYPGEQALTNYANALCLNEFQPYVGSAYTGSSLYYTYLYPSPRQLGRFDQARPGNRVYPAHHRRPTDTFREGIEALARLEVPYAPSIRFHGPDALLVRHITCPAQRAPAPSAC